MLGNREIMACNIRYFMERKNVNSMEVCRALDFKQNTFSDWINAKTYPRIDKIEKMANYFGISKADLVEERPKSFDTPMDFEIAWYKSGGGKHPIKLSEEEYSLILTYRSADDTTKDMINRILKYRELLEKRLNNANR